MSILVVCNRGSSWTFPTSAPYASSCQMRNEPRNVQPLNVQMNEANDLFQDHFISDLRRLLYHGLHTVKPPYKDHPQQQVKWS